MVTFGKRLKEIRTEKNITIEKMAKDLKSTSATISRYENDIREPKIDFINKAADYFNITTDYLLGRTNEKKCYIINNNEFQYEINKTKQDNEINEQLKSKLMEMLALFPNKD